MNLGFRRWAGFLALAALVGAVAAGPVAAAGNQLEGELLLHSNALGFFPAPPLPTDQGTLSLSRSCAVDDGTFSFTASGNANGALPGTFTLSGTGEMAAGELTTLVASFEITDGLATTVATGEISLTADAAAPSGSCSSTEVDEDEDGNPDYTQESLGARGTVAYAADVSAGGVPVAETGYAALSISCTTIVGQAECDLSETLSLGFLGGSLLRSASGTGSASTAGTATADDPIAVSVVGPADAEISLSESVAWPWGGGDYQILGRNLEISAYTPDGEEVQGLIALTFRIHQSLLDAAGVSADDVTLVRDGSAAFDCAGAGVADPDPCIESRTVAGDELVLVVLSTHASAWAAVVLSPLPGYIFDGFAKPVENPGENATRNIVKAGQAVPLGWRLTNAEGEPVLSLDSAEVAVTGFDCGLNSSADLPVESATGKSGLRNLGDGYYKLNWKSPKSYANSCKQLTLTLSIDGQTITRSALFQFRK